MVGARVDLKVRLDWFSPAKGLLYDDAVVPWLREVAVHSTFWHNNFGEPMSRGCIYARPEDSKWVFRWTLPQVSYDPGDAPVSMPGGTVVEVVQT